MGRERQAPGYLKQLKLKQLEGLKEAYPIDFLSGRTADRVAVFHAGFPMYQRTPLASLNQLAKRLGVGGIHVKDESHRFGLNAFKVLGGSFAIGQIIAQKLGVNLDTLDFAALKSREVRDKLGKLTFVTATDGNHGRGVAWMAGQLGMDSIVFMPRGSAQSVADNIAKEGARVTIQDANYDEAVRMANELAQEKGYIMVQDTAWDGYEDIPRWIMQGYLTMAWEMAQDMKALGKQPTHLFLQAGVGSLAAAATGYFAKAYPAGQKPIITIVEPASVDCIYRSAVANERVCIGGHYFTIMAGLACGEPNTVGLKVLLDYAENYLSAPDELAAYGMRVLGSPLPGDPRVISGESGAAPLGTIAKILSEPALAGMKDALKIDGHSQLLFVSTEGNTNPEQYLDIVWNGLYPS